LVSRSDYRSIISPLHVLATDAPLPGALFAVYGAGILAVSAFRRMQGNRQFFSEVGDDGLSRKRFRTSGNVVVVLTCLSVVAYITLLVLTLKLDK
jgi:hypothetical protein